ncbi:MAG: LysR family transcriptional regulator [Colwellia sp.]|nr:LysR family transcriptional regulator [Colwellia sp.]MCW8865650.1 LysR family transcriptional regulator [Colwellia sp.]MCW9083191.1 LysR family transcriptional regulator [Colwellia sp.]
MKRKIDLLKAMATFTMVIDKGSFSAASRELNIVTSAVSRQVSDLEEHFSCQLLYRSTRAMSLTAEGKQYLEQFRDILNSVERLENKSDDLHRVLTGHLTISAPSGSASLGFLKSTSDFMKLHPRVKISWLFVNRFVDMVQEGIDLSIRVGELPDSSFIARRYGSAKVNFVASPSYIQQNGQPHHPNALKTHHCLVDSSNRYPLRWQYQENGKEQHASIDAFAEANDGDTVAKLAAEGLGIAYLPTFLTQAYIDNGTLLPILTEFEFEQIPVSLVYPAKLMINPLLKSLVDFILAEAKTTNVQ